MRFFPRRSPKHREPGPEVKVRAHRHEVRHVLGGRDFLQVMEFTVQQDFRISAYARRAGLYEITMQADEKPEAFWERIINGVIASGDVLPILACLLVPEDRVPHGMDATDAWNLAIAEETEEFLGKLKAEDDRATICALTRSLITAFFDAGISSLYTSLTSSSEGVPDQGRAIQISGGMATGIPTS
jgi:hypothetical protein